MMHDLQNAYNNLKNHEIRIYAPWMKTVRICAFQASIVQNRSVWRIGELNRSRASALGCLNWKKFQITIDAHHMNSCDLDLVGNGDVKTVGEEGSRNMKQQEFLNLVENWESLDQKCGMRILEFLEKMEGKSVRKLCELWLWSKFSYD